jgi:hypothetical protein
VAPVALSFLDRLAMQTETADVQTTAIVDRPGHRRGFLATAWPVIALALMLMLLLRACVPAMQIAAVPLVPTQTAGPGATR